MHCIAIATICWRAYCVVYFFPFFNNIAIKLHSQLTDVTTSTLRAANCHWQNCRIWQNMHQQPPWPSFISLITRGIQWRILGRYFQCSDLLQIRLEESFPGSLDTEGASVLFEYFMAIILTTKIQSNIPFKLKSLRESVLNSLVFRLPNPKLLY